MPNQKAVTSSDLSLPSVPKSKKGVLLRQKRDLVALRGDIQRTRESGDLTPTGLANIARSTQILHSLERDAYDLGAPGRKVNAIMLLPVSEASMDEWNKKAKPHFPQAEFEDVTDQVGVDEPDVLGEAPPRPQDVPDSELVTVKASDQPAGEQAQPVKRKRGRPRKVKA